MTVEATDSTFRDALSRLQGGAAAMPWPDRRDLGRAIGEALSAGTGTDAALALAHVLAADPKWEVRLAVTDTLLTVPDDDFGQLMGRLGGDSNTYVRRAVERALQRRRKQEQANGRTRQSTDQVNEHLKAIQSEYGKAAAAKALRMCERYTELLIGSMVHDLRSILTHLKTNSHALIDEASEGQSSGKPGRAATRVRKDLDFLETAIADMEAFTQASTPERHRERLADVVAAALELARDNVRKSKLDPDVVSIFVDVPESLVVEVAKHQIVIALANVLKNALEAFACGDGTFRAGTIRVEAALVGDHAKVVVRDDGMGMSEEEAVGPLIFTPGRRNKTKRYSTGYGLPIAARNFAAHDGTLSLESRENEGTAVTMMLPLTSR
jgi:signal transduction histidine kinase